MFEVPKTMLSLDKNGFILAGKIVLAKSKKSPPAQRLSRAYLPAPTPLVVLEWTRKWNAQPRC